MGARRWYVELYVEFAEEVSEGGAEVELINAIAKSGGIGECEVVSIEQWVDDEHGEREEPYDPDAPVHVLDATPPRLTLVKPRSD
jgi:hypothetical protein